jgi:hypothetical protein
MKKTKKRFLSVYTPTYKRQQLLDRCMNSVLHQSLPCEHIIVHDHVGLGVEGVYHDIRNHAHRCTADYVMILNDDDYLIDADAVFDLWHLNHGDDAEVIAFKGDLMGTEFPSFGYWEERPSLGQIAISNFAIRNDIWLKHRKDWKSRYEADYFMADLLWGQGYRWKWLNRMVFGVDRVSRGNPELESAAT